MIDAIQLALRITMTARYLAMWLLCSVLLGFAGPFGTYEAYPFAVGMIYWFCVVAVSSVIGNVAILYCKTLIDPRRPILVDLAATTLMAVVFTPILYLWTQTILVDQIGEGPSLLLLFTYVCPVALAVYTGRRLIPGMEDISYVARSEPSAPPRLLRRLPNMPDQPILRLSSDDHLIDVVTGSDTFRIRLRLGDAVDEMDGVEGFYTHRSHWVVRDAIVGADKEKGRVVLRLKNGDTVPVSRTYKRQLEDAGVL